MFYNNHLKDSVGQIALRDFTTLDAQNLFDEIDRTKDLSHKSLERIQTGLSAIFTLAKQRNLVQANPVQGSRVEGGEQNLNAMPTRIKKSWK